MKYPLLSPHSTRKKCHQHRPPFYTVAVWWCFCFLQLLSNPNSISLIAGVAGVPVQRQQQQQPSLVSAVNMLEFMQRFGYLTAGEDPSNIGALYSESAVSDALRNVQLFGGLPQTGILDEETSQLMTAPRCGVPDIAGQSAEKVGDVNLNYRSNKRRGRRRRRRKMKTMKRQRRFVVGARAWLKRRITYFLANWSPLVGEEEMAQDMRGAFDEWAKYGNLKFVRVFTPEADIVVGFGSRYHGDSYPFDGPGNILAHAYYPYELGHYGGDIHFDNDEAWTRNTSTAPGSGEINFLSVAMHELGHALGLGHSSDAHNSIMFPYYKAGRTLDGQQLGYDDVMGMYNLYIRANLPEDDEEEQEDTHQKEVSEEVQSSTSVPTTTTVREPENEDETNTDRTTTEWTADDTATTPEQQDPPQNVTYHFHGDYETVAAHKRRFNYSDGTSTPMTTTIPSSTATSLFASWSLWPTPTTASNDAIADLCLGNFDAVAAINDHLFIFKNNLVWRLDPNLFLVSGYPVTISQQFVGVGDLEQGAAGDRGGRILDAAYQRQTDGAVVLIARHRFWTFNGTDFRLISTEGQRTIRQLGLPENVTRIDAVLVWPKNQKTYLFAGEAFWRYDEWEERMDGGGYPKSMTRWHGVPFNIDAATSLPRITESFSSGQTLFFKGNSYWLFNDHWVRPEIGYPRLISSLFNC